MKKYPDHFIDDAGFEWERGSFLVKGSPEDPGDKTFRWRFRPTQKCRYWTNMTDADKAWDYASEAQIVNWNIQITRELK